MFGFLHDLLAVTLVLVVHVQGQNVAPTTSGDPSGDARNGQGCVWIETAPYGNIFSPNYGRSYPPSVVCKWTIKAPVGAKIHLLFNDFLIEKSSNCKNDFLLLFDGPNDGSRKVGRYCETSPDAFTSSTNYIHLEFRSDISMEFRGFHASYNTTLSSTSNSTEKSAVWTSRPKMLNTLLNVTAIEGSLVKLICEVDGIPEPEIRWNKDSGNLTEDQRIIIKRSSFESMVTIKKVAVRDQGKYSCIGHNGIGPAISSYGWLVVTPRVLPLIKKTTENKTLAVGNKLILHCQADGPAPMKITWFEKDEELAEKKCDKNVDCKLNLTRIFVQDTVVTCEVVNMAGTVSRNVHISVKGPPLITHAPKDKNVQAGLSVNFTCTAVGQPPLKISWLKDNEVITEGVTTVRGRSVLTVTVAGNSTVTCTVKSRDGLSAKEARLFVEEKKDLPKIVALSFIITPENLKVEYNSSATLRCQAEGYPEPQLSWVQNGNTVTEAASVSDGVSTLTLKSLKKTVTVVCIARNRNEEINSTAKITVPRAQDVSSNKSGNFSNNVKLIVGAGGGVLLLTVIIIIFLVVRRRKRNKDVARGGDQTETMREDENLIPNPLFNKRKEEVNGNPAVERIHYSLDNIEHCEDIEEGISIRMFLGRANDLPFASGEYNIVVKVFKDDNPSEEKKEEFEKEASLLANLVHPNVVHLMAVCIKTAPLCLVFEYSEYGYLDEYLRECHQSDFCRRGKQCSVKARDSYTELAHVDRLFIAKQVASGMQYLTEKGYIHQELRARNCMVFKGLQVKVGNLGLRWANPEQNFFVMEPAEKKHFPVRWLPPEVILYGEYSESSDVWSFGVLVWEVFSDGQLPYSGINDSDIVSHVRNYNILPCPKACPHNVYEMLKSCWEMTPVERPNFSSLHETISSFYAGVAV